MNEDASHTTRHEHLHNTWAQKCAHHTQGAQFSFFPLSIQFLHQKLVPDFSAHSHTHACSHTQVHSHTHACSHNKHIATPMQPNNYSLAFPCSSAFGHDEGHFLKHLATAISYKWNKAYSITSRTLHKSEACLCWGSSSQLVSKRVMHQMEKWDRI